MRLHVTQHRMQNRAATEELADDATGVHSYWQCQTLLPLTARIADLSHARELRAVFIFGNV